jgi:hypothetical protein
MTTIAEQLALLFESDLPDPHLVLRQGQPVVASAPAPSEGVLDIASRSELLERGDGRPPTGRALEELAAGLETAVRTMGG